MCVVVYLILVLPLRFYKKVFMIFIIITLHKKLITSYTKLFSSINFTKTETSDRIKMRLLTKTVNEWFYRFYYKNQFHSIVYRVSQTWFVHYAYKKHPMEIRFEQLLLLTCAVMLRWRTTSWVRVVKTFYVWEKGRPYVCDGKLLFLFFFSWIFCAV